MRLFTASWNVFVMTSLALLLLIIYKVLDFTLNYIEKQQKIYQEEQQLRYLKILKGEVKNIAAISVSIPNGIRDKSHEEWIYVFYIPLTVQAWLRIGYDVTIHVVVDLKSIQPNAKKLFEIVMQSLLQMESVSVFYFDVETNLKIRLSQLLRIYSSGVGNFNNNSFLVLSDSDLWSLQKSRLELKPEQKILITNSDCCGMFEFNNKSYKHFPMAHIGMRVSDWMDLFPLRLTNTHATMSIEIQHFPLLISHGLFKNYFNLQSVQPLLTKMENMFGKGVYKTAIHGDSLWGIDQKHVSIAIDGYRKRYGDSTIKFVPYWSCIRVDRSNWEEGVHSKHCKADSHLLHGNVWDDSQWERLMLLMKTIFDQRKIEQFESYRRMFSSIYNKSV